jgi:hypothetical protein
VSIFSPQCLLDFFNVILAFVLGSDIKKKLQKEYYNKDFMYSDEVLWQMKKMIQMERWYQREINKEISVKKKPRVDPIF